MKPFITRTGLKYGTYICFDYNAAGVNLGEYALDLLRRAPDIVMDFAEGRQFAVLTWLLDETE